MKMGDTLNSRKILKYLPNLKFVLLFFLFAINKNSYSQNFASIIEKIKSGKIFTTTASASVSNVSFVSTSDKNTRQPNVFSLSANVNVTVLEWTFPFSFTVTDQSTNYSYDFNQFKLEPEYKWFKSKFGTVTESFSKYSYSSHQLVGGVVNLTPKNFEIGLLFGELRKKVNPDTLNIQNQPSYQRLGGAAKLFYKSKAGRYGLIFLYSQDLISNFDTASISKFKISPEDNMVLELDLSQSLFSMFDFKFNFALSSLNPDTRLGEISDKGLYVITPFVPKTNFQTFYALIAKVNFKHKLLTLGLSYERVQPNYKTHGGYFFTNDLETYSLNTSFSLFKKIFNITGSVGLQRDNLDQLKTVSQFKFSTSASVSFVLLKKNNISISYTNFASQQDYVTAKYLNPTANTTNLTNVQNLPPILNKDSLNTLTVNESFSVNASIVLGDPKNQNRITTSLAVQGVRAKKNEDPSNTITSSIGYSKKLEALKMNMSTNLSFNAVLNKNETYNIGSTVSLNRAFLKDKLKSSLSTSYFASISTLNTHSLNITTSFNYAIFKKQTINFSITNTNRFYETSNQNVSEFLFNLSYGISL